MHKDKEPVNERLNVYSWTFSKSVAIAINFWLQI